MGTVCGRDVRSAPKVMREASGGDQIPAPPWLTNDRTGDVIVTSVEFARTRQERRRGLLGRDGLPADGALVLMPCHSIHTVGMRFAIDVLFVDRRGRVRRIVRHLGPARLSICLRAKATVECAAGLLDRVDVQVGDPLSIVAERGREFSW